MAKLKYHDMSLVWLKRLAQACGAAVMLLALAALAGWISGGLPAAALRSSRVPMAPNTAVVFFVLGLGLVVFCTPFWWRYAFARVCGGVGLAVAVARLGEIATGLDWGVDHLLIRPGTEDMIGSIPVGRMSLFTAVTFLFAAAAMLLLSWSAGSRLFNSVAGSVAVIVAFTGLVFCLGYVYGSPLLYRGSVIPLALGTAAGFLLLGTGQILIVAARETGERRLSRRRQRAQHAVTRALTSSEEIDQALPDALRTVCRELMIDYGALWRKGRQGGPLRITHVWHEETPELDLFASVSRELEFARGEDLPGQVEAAREPVWVYDLAAERDLPRGPAAAEAGLHGAFCGPIIVGGEFLGALEFISGEHLEMDRALLRTMTDICGQVGQYVMRKQAEQVLRENEQRTRLIIETANDAFIETSSAGEITDWNRQAEAIFGWSREEALGRKLVETIIPARARRAHELDPENLRHTGDGSILNRRVEMTAVHRDGHTFPVEVTAWPIESGGMLRFNFFIRDITERKRAEEELAAKTAEMQQELEIAREFQEALLPSEYPQVPDRDLPDPLELHFHHVYKPAFTVGGDFFDVIKLSDHRAGIFIADVMGHGARSALITAILRTLLQDLAQETDDPGRFLELLNRYYMDIVERSHQFVFASAFYLIIDTETSTATFASAGHPSPLIADRLTRRVTTLVDYGRNGPALGFVRDATYESMRRPIEREDVFILFTDGLVEAVNRSLDEFGYERFAQIVQENIDAPLAELSQAVVGSVNEFAGSTMLSDDLCLVLVEVSERSGRAGMTPEEQTGSQVV